MKNEKRKTKQRRKSKIVKRNHLLKMKNEKRKTKQRRKRDYYGNVMFRGSKGCP